LILKTVAEELRDQLEQRLHVNAMLSETVSVPPELQSGQRLYINTPTRLTTKTGQQIDADLVFFTVGGKPNTEFLRSSQSMPSQVFTSSGHIQVNEYLQVDNGKGVRYSNIYALGDVSTHQPGMAYWAGEEAKALARNFIDLQNGTASMKPVKQAMSGMMLVPLGAKWGVGQLTLPWFGAVRVGPWVVSMLKGKGLLADRYKAIVNAK